MRLFALMTTDHEVLGVFAYGRFGQRLMPILAEGGIEIAAVPRASG